jgi:hypothetical protein
MQNVLDKLRWPQVGLLAVILTAAVTAIVLVPEAKWHVIPWGSIASGIALVGAAITGLFLKPVVDEKKAADRRAERAKSDPPPPSGEAGFVDVRLLYLTAAIGLFMLGCAVLPGCGASALRAHGTAAFIATRVVATADDVYLAHLDATQAACRDEACVEAARESHRPAEAALELTRVAVRSYVDAVEIANNAEESGDIITALIDAAMRVIRRYAEVVAAMAGFGVELPELPIGGGAS